MEIYWYNDIIIVLVIVILLQWMVIYNVKFNCSNESYSTLSKGVVTNITQSTSIVHSVAPTGLIRGSGGVAVTTFLGSPKWYQNRYSMMVNQMLATLPEDWAVQIFYQPATKMAVEGINYPGLSAWNLLSFVV